MTSDKRPSRKVLVGHPVLPGGLSTLDHDRIHDLAERGWKGKRIARNLSKHPSTVYSYMYTAGLVSSKQTDEPRAFSRGDRTIRQFSREEDAFIVALRVQGYRLKQIAEYTSKRFGFQRQARSISCRLAMLASLDIINLREAA